MHLPCPSCGTTYDVDLNVYTPGTSFQCVGCQAIVTVPAAPGAQAAEEELPILEGLEEEISPTVDFKDSDVGSISESLGVFDEEADKQEAEESLAVLDDIFPSSPSVEFTTPEPPQSELPELDLEMDVDLDVDLDMDIDPFEDEGPSTVDFSEEEEETALPPSTSMSGALDASFLDELMPSEPGDNSLESIGQELGNQDSAIDLTSDLHAASLLDDNMSPMGPAGDESIPNLMDELSAEMPTAGNLGASLNDFTPGVQQAVSDDLDFNFDEFNEPLATPQAEPNHIAGARAHAITETPAFEQAKPEKSSSSRQIVMFVVLIGLAGVAAAVSLDFESLLDSGSSAVTSEEAKLEEIKQEKIRAALAKKKAAAAKLAEAEKLRKANRPLARDNADQLRFSELSAAMKNDIADKPLKAWAAYRLQNTYDTPVDPKQTPLGPVDPSDDLTVALEGVRLLAAGEGEPSRQLLEGTWRKSKTAAPAVGLVLSRLYAERDMTKKAESVLASLVKAHPAMLDARLDLAKLIMAGNRPAKGAQLLTENIDADTSADHILVRMDALLDKKRFSEASKLAEALQPAQDSTLSKSLQATLLNAQAYSELLVGKTETSRKQIEASKKTPLEKALALAQLTQMTGGKATEELQAFAATLPADASVEKARIAYLQATFALEAKDVAAAKQFVEQVASLPPKLTQGWVQLARGDIAMAAGKAKQARASYKAGLKVRAAFPEANIALELSSGRKLKETLARLSRVRGDNRHPVITLALADAMLQKGNHDGAVSLYEEVLWTTPTAANPTEIVDNLLKALTHAKRFERALKIGQGRYNNTGKAIETAEQMAQIADTYGEREILLILLKRRATVVIWQNF